MVHQLMLSETEIWPLYNQLQTAASPTHNYQRMMATNKKLTWLLVLFQDFQQRSEKAKGPTNPIRLLG